MGRHIRTCLSRGHLERGLSLPPTASRFTDQFVGVNDMVRYLNLGGRMNCPSCGSEDTESRRIDECECGWGQTSPIQPPAAKGCYCAIHDLNLPTPCVDFQPAKPAEKGCEICHRCGEPLNKPGFKDYQWDKNGGVHSCYHKPPEPPEQGTCNHTQLGVTCPNCNPPLPKCDCACHDPINIGKFHQSIKCECERKDENDVFKTSLPKAVEVEIDRLVKEWDSRRDHGCLRDELNRFADIARKEGK